MISEELKTYRQRVINYLKIISSFDEQNRYQEALIVSVPDKLLCMWFDDLAMPASLELPFSIFDATELDALRNFSEKLNKMGFVIRRPNEINLEELLKNQDWQEIVSEASLLLKMLNR